MSRREKFIGPWLESCPKILPCLFISLQDDWIEELELTALPSVACERLEKMGKLEMSRLQRLSFVDCCTTALSVPWLNLKTKLVTHEMAYFQRMFPRTTKLHCECLWIGSPFAEIWAHWPELEELAVEHEITWGVNYDAEMCGIFEDDVDFLRTQSTEYVQAVHIVPVRPALTTMSNLQTLRIELDAPDDEDSTEMELFSCVTSYLAFKGMPELIVTINCEAGKVLSLLEHLKEYVLFATEAKKFGATDSLQGAK